FSLHPSTQCFCATYLDNPTAGGYGKCDIECAGDRSEACGGYDAINVYRYGHFKGGDGDEVYGDAVEVSYPTYLGCWGDDARYGHIMQHQTLDDAMTNEVSQCLPS
ncbi:unnamed protein product, partial [Laminaria digitata]